MFSLMSPSQAEPLIAKVFAASSKCQLLVSEEHAFGKRCLPLGTVSLVSSEPDPARHERLVQRGAFEWRLPCLDETKRKVACLLGLKDGPDDRVRRAMDEIASIAARVGCIYPRFDPVALEEMPFRRTTTLVVDTSSVLQGALDFAARFLHPGVRLKIPAIAQMEIANQTDRFLKTRRAESRKPGRRSYELLEHLRSQGGQRALLRVELHAETEVERTYLLGDPLRSAFQRDTEDDIRELSLSVPVRSYADRLILESARHHQSQSGPAHPVRLLTADQGLARMAMAEGISPLFFRATKASDIFGRRLAGQTFAPFSGHMRHTPLADLIWELATSFGSVRIECPQSGSFQVSAIGEQFSWAPYHAEEDLLWCCFEEPKQPSATAPVPGRGQPEPPPEERRRKEEAPEAPPRGSPTPGMPANRTDNRADHEEPGRHVARSSAPAISYQPGVARGAHAASFLRLNVERLFELACLLDDQVEVPVRQVEELVGGNGSEYRRFLRTGGLVVLGDGEWVAGKRIPFLAAALRNERVEDVREALLEVPSFKRFGDMLQGLSRGEALDGKPLRRGLATYRTLGEVTLLCASVSMNRIYATPNSPEPEEFANIVLRRFPSLDRDGSGLVATGEWLEDLLQHEGIHPEVARRQLRAASELGLLRRSTEGSTTQLRHRDRVVHVLRTDSAEPVVERVFLYRGDYLIPGKASASLRIEGIRP